MAAFPNWILIGILEEFHGCLLLPIGKFVKSKHCWVLSTNFWKQKVSWHPPAMFCLGIPGIPSRQKFNFLWRCWDQIQAIFWNLFYSSQFDCFHEECYKNLNPHNLKVKCESTPSEFILSLCERVHSKFNCSIFLKVSQSTNKTYFISRNKLSIKLVLCLKKEDITRILL